MENYNIYQDYDQILFKEEVAAATRKLNIDGFSPSGESGDTSVRDPKSGFIYISGSPDWCFQKNLQDARGWERFITDTNETIYVPWSTPTVEWYTHTAVYRKRPDANACIHTHGEWASVFAILEMDVPLSIIGEGLTGVIPCAKYIMPGTKEVGEVTADALIDNPYNCCIMGNHGGVAVGKTMDEAYATVAWMEQAAKKAFYMLLVQGGAKVDTSAVLKKLAERG